MHIARTREHLDDILKGWRAEKAHVTLVPTMGALHAGHVSLIEHAHRRSAEGRVVASIFVNPLQFGQSDDLARYPRDEEGDLAKLRDAGCAAVWLPDVATMYPPGDTTRVEPGGPAFGWEGDARPGHFAGVATVVAKLFGQCKPDAACFGEKDWQQLAVIGHINRDLCLGVHIVGVPTMRESDGLAMSSRNRFLTTSERAAAPKLFAALLQSVADMGCGARATDALNDARTALERAGLRTDYLALVAGSTLARIEKPQSGARIIAAARLGSVRLLDNVDAA